MSYNQHYTCFCRGRFFKNHQKPSFSGSVGVAWKNRQSRCARPADYELCIQLRSNKRWLKKWLELAWNYFMNWLKKIQKTLQDC